MFWNTESTNSLIGLNLPEPRRYGIDGTPARITYRSVAGDCDITFTYKSIQTGASYASNPRELGALTQATGSCNLLVIMIQNIKLPLRKISSIPKFVGSSKFLGFLEIKKWHRLGPVSVTAVLNN